MNKYSASALLAISTLLPCSALTLGGVWLLNPQSSVQAPLMVDSLTISGNKYATSSLLDSPAPLRVRTDAKPLSADSVLSVPTATAQAVVSELFTRLRPQAYTSGTLTVHCPVPFALYIDGKRRGVSESLSPTGSVSAALSMTPYSEHEVAVRLVSQSSDTLAPTLRLDWKGDERYNDVSVMADATALRRFGLDDTVMGERVSSMSVSPSGKWLITAYENMYDADKTLRHSTLTNLQTGAVSPLPTGTHYSWIKGAPHSLWAAIPATEGYDIVRLEPGNMKQTTIASGVPQQQVSFNHDATRLYYTVTETAKEQTGPLKRQLSPGSRAPGETDGSALWEWDIPTGTARRLTWGGNVQIADVHPTQDKLLLLSGRETPTRRPFFEFEAIELTPATMQTDTVVPTTGFLSGISYSPDGKKALVLGSAAIYDGIGERIGDEPIPNDFDIQAYELTLSNKAVKPLSIDFDPSIKQTHWATDGNIYMMVQEGYENNVYALNPSTLKYTRLPLSIENIRAMSVSADGAEVAYWGQGADYAGAGALYDTRRRKDTLTLSPLAERLKSIDMAKAEHVDYVAPDGTTIDGWLTLPPDFDATQKYPLIVYYYGGTSPTQKQMNNPYTPQLFASRGYVVYTLNPSGTTGYGQEFAARHVNAWGKRTAQDIIGATEALCATHPYIDKDKIGCLGASYGGFMTEYLQTLTPMFAAAVSHAGISNVTSYWGEGFWGHSYNSVAAADSYPWSNPDLFTKQGALFNADKIHTPLLLLHGTADTNVPVGESIQLFSALRILGRPVEFIGVEGENHFISNYTKRRQWQDSIMAWFELWLKGDPAWWSAMYPDSPYASPQK